MNHQASESSTSRGPRLLAIIATAGLCGMDPARATDLDLTLRAGDSYTNNVGYTEVNKKADHIAGVAGAIGLSRTSPRVDARINVNVAYAHYVDDSYADQFQRGLSANVKLNFLSGRLVWETSESYGPALEDPLAANRPDNLSYDNYLATGPRFKLGALDRIHGSVGVQYSRVDYGYGNTPGSDQLSGEASVVLPENGTTEMSLNLRARGVRQRQPDVPMAFAEADFDVREAFLRLAAIGSRSGLRLEGGASSLNVAGASSTAPLARASLDRRLTPRVTLTASVGSQYQDSIGRYWRLQKGATAEGAVDPSLPREDIVNSGSAMLDRYLELTLAYEGVRTSAYMHGSFNRVKFEESPDPLARQEYTNLSFGIERRIGPVWTLNFLSDYSRRSYGQLGRRDDDMLVLAEATWHFQPKMDLSLQGYQHERHSNSVGADYAVRLVRLEIVYRPYSIAPKARKDGGRQPR